MATTNRWFPLFLEWQEFVSGGKRRCEGEGHALKMGVRTAWPWSYGIEVVECVCGESASTEALQIFAMTNRKRLGGCAKCGTATIRSQLFTGTYDRCPRCEPVASEIG